MATDSHHKDGHILQDILPFAAAAPSPLNTQPWQVVLLSSLRTEVFIESTRLLRNLDPRCRQAMISLGAFLENFDIAARQAGFATDITNFPSDWPEPRLDVHAPVARIDLTLDEKVVRDPLFRHITNRRSDRGVYKRIEIDPEWFGILAGSFDSGPAPISLGYTTHNGLKSEIAGFLVDAEELELSDHARLAETLAWVGFSSKDGGCCRTGLSLGQLGLSTLANFYARLVMKVLRNPRKEEFMKRTLISLVKKQAYSSAAFGWIASREDHRITQVRAGRVYERVNLSATSIGLSIQPMTPIIRDYEDMRDLRQTFSGLLGIPDTHTVQMFFRIGYSGPGPAVPRLSVEELIS
jgi:hypothetical protein